MPFSQFTASYDPETLGMLTRVFQEAWVELRSRGTPNGKENEARELLAARIVQAFNDGERDPTRLKTAALNGVATN